MSGLEKFSKAALNFYKMGCREQIVSSLLIRANLSGDGLKKVKLICESAMLTEDKEGKINQQEIQDLYAVASSLDSFQKDKTGAFSISWSFPNTEENFNKFIKPWHKTFLGYYPLKLSLARKYLHLIDPYGGGGLNEVYSKVSSEMKTLSTFKGFFDITQGALNESGYYTLKAEFSQYALLKLMEVQKIIAKTISPNIYSEAFSGLMKPQNQTEELPIEGEEL